MYDVVAGTLEDPKLRAPLNIKPIEKLRYGLTIVIRSSPEMPFHKVRHAWMRSFGDMIHDHDLDASFYKTTDQNRAMFGQIGLNFLTKIWIDSPRKIGV